MTKFTLSAKQLSAYNLLFEENGIYEVVYGGG
jgi:hypothetical protein